MADNELMNKSEAEVFAQGLLWVARVDGVDESETELIQEFLSDAGYGQLNESLQSDSFEPHHLLCLGDSHLRQVFLKTAVGVVLADGKISEAEINALHSLSTAIGMERELLQIALDERFHNIKN
jgi:tellurite resistance protein